MIQALKSIGFIAFVVVAVVVVAALIIVDLVWPFLKSLAVLKWIFT